MHQSLEVLVADDFVKLEGLIDQIFGGDFEVHTGALLDVLVGGIFNESYDVFYLHVLWADSDLAADEGLEVLDSDELAVEFHEVGGGVSINIEKDTHPHSKYNSQDK